MKNKIFLMRTGLLILGIAFISFSCLDMDEESDYEKQQKLDDQALTGYLSDSIQAQKHSSGFYYKVLTTNDTGRSLTKGNVVEFQYKISLLNGTLLEESTSPARLKLLTASIVPEALDRGISLMKTGEKFRFYIPSYLAYGNYRNAKIPANANLITDITIVNVKSETDIEVAQLDSIESYVSTRFPTFEKFASGLYFIDSLQGTGDRPHEGDRVVISFTRKYLDGTIIKSVQDITIYIGYNQAVQGLEEGIMQMREGGKAILVMPASIAFKQSLTILPQSAQADLFREGLIRTEVLPYKAVQYSVELKSVN